MTFNYSPFFFFFFFSTVIGLKPPNWMINQSVPWWCRQPRNNVADFVFVSVKGGQESEAKEKKSSKAINLDRAQNRQQTEETALIKYHINDHFRMKSKLIC